MSHRWQPTDDAIRAALTPATSVRAPIGLAASISAEIAATAQRPALVALGPWNLAPQVRRSLVLGLAVVALLLAVLALVAGARHEPIRLADVPTYHGNPGRTDVMPGPGPSSSGPPSIAWRIQLGASVASAPAVSGGVAYVGDGNGDLHALDETSGSILWTRAIGSPMFDGPAVGDGKVFIGSEDGSITAVRADTGAVAWTVATGGAVGSSPVDIERVVIAGSEDGWVYALDAATGVRRWATHVAGPVSRAIAEADGVLYVPCDVGIVDVLDLATGAERWQARVGEGSLSTPAVAGGVLYEAAGIDDPGQAHQFLAIDLATRSVRWRYATPTNARLFVGPVTGATVVVTGWEDNGVHALVTTTGAPIWDAFTNGPDGNNGVVVGDVLYVPSADEHVYAFDLATGRLIWTVPIVGAPTAAAVVDGRVIVGTDAGLVLSIGRPPAPGSSP